MVVAVAQTWVESNFTKNDTKMILEDKFVGIECAELTGKLEIDGYNNLEEINFERKDAAGNAALLPGGITEVIIRNCSKLKKIDLDNNKIIKVVLEGNFNDLHWLDVQSNQLTKIDVSKVPNLNNLNLVQNTNFDQIEGLENLNKLAVINLNGTKGINGKYYKKWKDAIKNLLNITDDDLPASWEADLAGKLGGKKLTDIPTGKTLKDLIDNFSSEKSNLQQQLTQAQAELNKKQDYDTIKAERDELKQQLEAIKNELGLGNDAAQQQIIDKIKDLMGRPTTPSDYNAVKSQKDNLQAELDSKNKKITELENQIKNNKDKGNNNEDSSNKVLNDITNWGIKLSDEKKDKLRNASTNDLEKMRNEIVKTEVDNLKKESDSSFYLNVGLGTLAISSLILLGWIIMRQNDSLKAESSQEKVKKS